ncbi:helix-turn-helix domain-containing protein [Bdellovibrio sp. BCCA]|uniref:helix-turn-helix domain-containing protein n=1 Tax=Bdellovibrio sp. BCCA TaxID=3136281 RepID=UPI0030F328F1
MTDFKSQQIKDVLKSLLRKKKMTYEEVAEELDCSVPTVKRILGPEELSLSRLLEFCEILDVTLSDIEVLTKSDSDKKEEFTEEQQIFLAKNKSFLSYLILLYNMTPAEIAEKYKLTQRSTDKYLIGLEKQELIRVTSKQKVKPRYKELPTLGHGVLAKAYYENFIATGAKFFTRDISDSLYSGAKDGDSTKKGFSINSVRVSRATYLAYIEERLKAQGAFLKLASYEEKSQPKESLMTGVMMDAWTLVENENKNLSLLENTFADITNL